MIRLLFILLLSSLSCLSAGLEGLWQLTNMFPMATNVPVFQDVTNVMKTATNNFDASLISAGTLAALRLPAIYNSSQETNKITSQSANYNILITDYLVLLTGAHTATLPTAVGIPGKIFTIQCSSAGTNAILTTSAQTISGKGILGATKWTNSAVGNCTILYSDNANWWILKTDN